MNETLPSTSSSKAWTRFFWIFAALSSFVFALSYGLQFGVSNQTTYLVHALTYFDPELLPRDWYTRQAADVHNLFSHLGAFLFRFDAHPQIFAGLEVLCTTLGCLAIAALVRSVVDEDKDAAVVFGGWLVFAFVFRTFDVMSCFMFSGYFQPSSIGNLGLLWAMALFARQRYFASGAALGVLGAWHLNYLALGVILFGGAHVVLAVVDDTKPRIPTAARRMFAQMIVPFFACLWALPKFLAAAGASSPESLHIVADIRAGHHYLPTYLKLLPSLAWQGAALLLFVGHVRANGKKMATSLRNVWVLCAAFGGFIVVAAPLTVSLHINTVIMLLPSRVAPQATMLAELLLLGCAFLALRGSGPRQWVSLVVAAVVAGVWAMGAETAHWLALLAGVVVVAGVARRFVPRAAAVVAVVAVVAVAADSGHEKLAKFTPTVTGENPRADGLIAWARTKSEKNALFAVPPGLIHFRLMGRRSIVVDWKSVGVNAADVLEWYRRVNLVAGTKALRSRNQAYSGYDNMDVARAQKLHDELGVDYVVMAKNVVKAPLGPVAWQDRRYVVYDLRAPPPAPADQ